MKPFFSYMGSKYKLSAKDNFYPAPAGKVCEPFCGSACYSVYHDVSEAVLIDNNPEIIDLWNFLISAKESDIEAIPTNLTNDIFVKIPYPQKILVNFWTGKGSAKPNRNKLSSWYLKNKESKNAWVWGKAAKERIIKQLPLIRNWKAICGNYSMSVDADTFFIDPPYASKAGKSYKHHKIKWQRYESWIKNLPSEALKIICENSDNEIDFKSKSGNIKEIKFYNSLSKKTTYEYCRIIGDKQNDLF